jgi:hypothetical protein
MVSLTLLSCVNMDDKCKRKGEAESFFCEGGDFTNHIITISITSPPKLNQASDQISQYFSSGLTYINIHIGNMESLHSCCSEVEAVLYPLTAIVNKNM